MKNLLVSTVVASFLLMGYSAHAQTVAVQDAASPDGPVGKKASTVMIRICAIGVMPQNSSSYVSAIGGKADVTNTPGPEADL